MNSKVLTPEISEPVVSFTQAEIVWKPWLAPLAEEDLTNEHKSAFKSAAHAKSPYFRLLARDAPILRSRSRSDQDIFYNTKTGLPRAERELAAVGVSRHNGCIYCASVHARFASTYSKRKDDVDALLNQGLKADLGPRWNAVVAAGAALSDTPPSFGKDHVDALRRAGLDAEEIIDTINCAAFFNWANRLMLSLGEPDRPGS